MFYKVFNITHPDGLCVNTSEEAQNRGIDFNDEDDLSEQIAPNRKAAHHTMSLLEGGEKSVN